MPLAPRKTSTAECMAPTRIHTLDISNLFDVTNIEKAKASSFFTRLCGLYLEFFSCKNSPQQ